ncbi:hypothetical protein [Enterovibrio coralii]|uniref:Toxin co-regulated pilus biosynthesis protein D n=1 Tax=Enterovibrio coralii TaxID=294935 RepID=A0A135I5X9_9GAMM|nr:hypothetical protein [Enterovibrio coralii]KXF80794.1 hypothetical protein ATN88_16070 [Enterovibrio coralii]
MVILDKVNLKFGRKTIVVSGIAIAAVIVIGGIAYKKQADEKVLQAARNQAEALERNHKAQYSDGMITFGSSSTLSDIEQLQKEMYTTKLDMEPLGWSLSGFDCDPTYCNVEFSREPNAIFQYVEIKRAGEVYTPIFGENELLFENVKFADDKEPIHEEFAFQSCTDLISLAYELKTTLGGRLVEDMGVGEPQFVFAIPKDYSWATHKGLKKFGIDVSYQNMLAPKLIKDFFGDEHIVVDSYSMNGSTFSMKLNAFCI